MSHSLKIFFSNITTSIRVWIRWTKPRRGFWVRAVFCWLLAVAVLKFDESDSYDLRFKLRGSQEVSKKIVLINLETQDLTKNLKQHPTVFNFDEDYDSVSDNFYWDQKIWTDLLKKILSQNPHSIGVTLYLGSSLQTKGFHPSDYLLFQDPRIIWATNSSELEKLSLPFAAKTDRSNIAHVDLIRDDDGIVRRLLVNPVYLPNMAQRISNQIDSDHSEKLPLVNYRSLYKFNVMSYKEATSSTLPDNFFKDKIVLIGADSAHSSKIQTPLGLMSRNEFWAHVTDNVFEKRFIQRLPFLFYVICLLGLTIFAVFIITHYPQSVSLFGFIWIATLWTAFSVWSFDTYFVWIPVISPLVLLLMIWFLYIGYQALRIEQAHTRLQQEQRYIHELEQLKNNFVSLISHDLKTPIAKIQAVLDRLHLQKDISTNLQIDLSNLKDYSEELNRYIQSILKVLRVESKDFKINKEASDLNEIISDVVANIKPLAQSKNIQISLQLEPMFLIEVDSTLMTEVFLNLIENAIKYTPESGHVSIKTSESDHEVLIEIADTGEGISSEEQGMIWNKFVRGHSQDMRTKGSGLGLYLVKYFIELHGGHISLNSELGKGTTFYIRLPLDPV